MMCPGIYIFHRTQLTSVLHFFNYSIRFKQIHQFNRLPDQVTICKPISRKIVW